MVVNPKSWGGTPILTSIFRKPPLMFLEINNPAIGNPHFQETSINIPRKEAHGFFLKDNFTRLKGDICSTITKVNLIKHLQPDPIRGHFNRSYVELPKCSDHSSW